MSWGWDHILANPLFLDHVCFASLFNPLGTDLMNFYIPGCHGTFCFHLKITQVWNQSCAASKLILLQLKLWNHRFMSSPKITNFSFRSLSRVICGHNFWFFCHWCTRHLWPDPLVFVTDALMHFSQHLLQWYLISSLTQFIHQSTQSMNSWHTSIYSMCDLIFNHDPAHCYIQYTEVPIILVFQVIVWTCWRSLLSILVLILTLVSAGRPGRVTESV
jgi:hypothetical protein